MDPNVKVAIISGIATIIGIIISALISSSLMKYRIEQLEKKVDKHNNLIERVYIVEKDISVIKNEIQNIEKGD